ncbi:MAG: hypothetical protein ACYTGZ_07800 [Planctomycetota bacterium]|jgi:bifunctional DNA-binding transcriptional regulator/antitoxin component of YhaV-PrlF toxin-antitoxin module
MAKTYSIQPDGSIKLPHEALEAIGAEPGDEVRLFIDGRKKVIRIERHSDDPWADALKEKPKQDMEGIFEEQKRRQAEAEAIFKKRLKDSKPGEGKPDSDSDKWR